MRNSCGDAMDPFFSAIEQALSVHQAEVNGLAARLQQQYEVSEKRQMRISELEARLQGIQTTVSQAKKKIITLRDENRKLRELLERDSAESAESRLPSGLAESAEKSGTDRGSPSYDGAITPNRRGLAAATHPMNKTGVSLFSETLIATPMSETDHSQAGESHDQSRHISVTSEESVAGMEAGSTSNCSGDSDIILVDEATRIPAQSSQPSIGSGGGTSINSREEVGGVEKAKGSHDKGCDVTVAGEEAQMESETGSETGTEYGESDLDTSPPAVATSTAQPDHNPKAQFHPKQSGRPLSLRDGAGKARYRYKELSSQGSSNSNQTSANAPANLLSPNGNDDRNISPTVSSPEADLQDSSSSAHSGSASPSLLRSSSSPWIQPPPAQEQPLLTAPSLSDIRPSEFSTPAVPVRGLFTTAVSDNVTRLGIPISDSQLSLDVSQTMPMSPELCSKRNRPEPPSKIPPLIDQSEDSVLLPRQAGNDSSKPKDSSVIHPPGHRAAKPPLPTVQTSRPCSRETKHPKRRKSRTLEQVALHLKQTLLNADNTPGQEEKGISRLKLSTRHHTPSVVRETPACLSVLPVTPGLKPASNIPAAVSGMWASRGNGATMMAQSSKQQVRSHDSENQDGDCEEMPLPRKRPHLMAEEENDITVIDDADPGSYELEDRNDETRLPGRTASEVMYIDLDSSLSSPEQDREPEGRAVEDGSAVSPSVLETRLHSRAGAGNQGRANAPQRSVNEPIVVERTTDIKDGNGGSDAGRGGNSINRPDHDQYARQLAARAGLPTYKCVAPIRRRADRDKLDAKACPDCQAWYDGQDGIHRDPRDHLRHTCRHKALYLPPDEDERMWDISFPSTEECERVMHRE